ncbi:MAG: EamA family transporter [Clostridia bacterium]|nr:EamA family transporter [Clostridia bacterium]
MPYLFLIVSVLLCVTKSSAYNIYAKGEKPNLHGVFRFNFVSYALACVFLFLLSIGGSISMPTVFCALGYAVIVLLLQSLMVFAMKSGSMATVSLLNVYGMVIPAIAGPIFWKEPFGILQGIGLVAMILSIFFLNEETQTKENGTETEKGNKLWILLGACCFLLSGLAGLMEKMHQSTSAKGERFEFLALAYATMFLLSLSVCLSTKKQATPPADKKRFLFSALSVGVVAGVYSSVNLYLAGTLDSLVYFPVANGGALLLTVFISIVVFREKLKKKKAVGFILGLLSVILLCIPS